MMPNKDEPLHKPFIPPAMPREELPLTIRELLDRQAEIDRSEKPSVPAHDKARDAADAVRIFSPKGPR